MSLLKYFIIVLLFFSFSVNAEIIRLDTLHRQTESKIPICIPVFSGDSSGKTIASVVNKDLKKYGSFVDAGVSKRNIYTLDSADRKKGEIHYSNWKNLGVQLLGKGEVKNNGKLEVEFQLFAPFSGKRIFGKKYIVSSRAARQLGHKIADDIIENFLREKGFFSSKLLFVNGSGKRKNVYISDSDGLGAKPLTSESTLNLFPDWFPDKKNILYTSYCQGRPIIYKKNIVSGKISKFIAMPGMNVSGAISPDGRKLAVILDFNGHPDLYVIDIKTGKRKRLTSGRPVESSPSWSSDSKKIVYSSDSSAGRPQIYIISATGGKAQRLTSSSFSRYCTSPAWSPDGKKIAFVAQLGGNYEICLYDIASRQTYKLTNDNSNDESPSWARNSRHLAFARTYGNSSWIMLLDSETGKVSPLVQKGKYSGAPAFEP